MTQETTNIKQKRPFPKQAAIFGWLAPLSCGVLGYTLNRSPELESIRTVLIGFLVLTGVLVLTGLIMSCIALASVKRLGWRGLLIPGLIGLVLNAGNIYGFAFVAVSGSALAARDLQNLHDIYRRHTWKDVNTGDEIRITLNIAQRFTYEEMGLSGESYSGGMEVVADRRRKRLVITLTVEQQVAGAISRIGSSSVWYAYPREKVSYWGDRYIGLSLVDPAGHQFD